MANTVIKLDNPTWFSLTETHKNFAIDFNGINFYQPDYCPFGGFTNHNTTNTGIDKYALLTNNFYVVGEKPFFNNTVQLKKNLVCNQMLLNNQIDFQVSEQIIKIETIDQRKDLLNLVNLVQPGYFKSKNSDLGDYYGIFKDDKLVAVTGERMKMNEYTEVSAVITHPEHIEKGYAKQLVSSTSNKIFNEGKIPYLHVADTNNSAINLYEKLGFTTRRKISFWNFTTNEENVISNQQDHFLSAHLK